MDKFEKRLRKISKFTDNSMVVGSAFGNIEKILSIYNTVFVIGQTDLEFKAKNLVYKEDFNNLNHFTEINAIFFDLNKINFLEDFKEIWQRNNSKVVIEGNDCIEREFSKPLYDTGWGCTSLQGFFHVWEKIK